MTKITARLPGKRILLAEDYFINQELTKDLLELMECVVDLAEDGNEALEMWSQNEYDLILMDIQMPNRDGYSTTIEIRNEEKKTGKHVPIIALTANAMAGDDKKCIEAGMDDYLSKPIDPQLLQDKLIKLLAKTSDIGKH